MAQEKVPADQHIPALVVAGDETGLRRTDDAVADDRAALLKAFEDTLAEKGLVICTLSLLKPFVGIPGGSEGVALRCSRIIGHIEDGDIITVPAFFPGKESGRAGDAHKEGIGTKDLAIGILCLAVLAAEVGLTQVFQVSTDDGGEDDIFRAARTAIVEMNARYAFQEEAGGYL